MQRIGLTSYQFLFQMKNVKHVTDDQELPYNVLIISFLSFFNFMCILQYTIYLLKCNAFAMFFVNYI